MEVLTDDTATNLGGQVVLKRNLDENAGCKACVRFVGTTNRFDLEVELVTDNAGTLKTLKISGNDYGIGEYIP